MRDTLPFSQLFAHSFCVLQMVRVANGTLVVALEMGYCFKDRSENCVSDPREDDDSLTMTTETVRWFLRHTFRFLFLVYCSAF